MNAPARLPPKRLTRAALALLAVSAVCPEPFPSLHRLDPFLKKEWYDIKAPSNFSVRSCGKTPVTRTTGTSTPLPSLCSSQQTQRRKAGIRRKAGVCGATPFAVALGSSVVACSAAD